MNIYLVTVCDGHCSVHLIYPDPAVIATNLATEEEALALAMEEVARNEGAQVIEIHLDGTIDRVSTPSSVA